MGSNIQRRNMEDRLTLAKEGILAEYEDQGTVDSRKWVTEYPDLAGELLDFIVWVQGSPREGALGAQPWEDEGGVLEAAFQDALSAAGRPRRDAVRRLADDLAVARCGAHARLQGRAPRPFRRAAVLSWTVNRLHARRGRVTRLATQKTAYLLERCLSLQLFDDHQKMRLGPYDPKARYRDAEPIARGKQWLQVKGAVIAPGPNVEEAEEFASRYLGSIDAATRLVDLLASLSDAELETLATIDAAALELRAQHLDVTVDAIRTFLAGVPEWREKLTRENFSDRAIARALQRVSRLCLDTAPE